MTSKKFISILTFLSSLLAQDYHTMEHDNWIREYYVSYPENSLEPCPLIINMHGFGGNALGQRFSSEMDDYALPQGVAVVYPQGLGASWSVGTFWTSFNYADDVDFISQMIDKIAQDYSIDLNRVYATGMSNGGYMAYELGCELSHKIAAFGSVTGNFMLNDDQNCILEKEIPIMHIHGTSDLVVDYYPPSFDQALTVSESMDYWNSINVLDSLEIISIDGSEGVLSAEKFTWFRNGTNTQFIHYKVEDGGHQWFGSPYANASVVNSSELLVDFFLEYNLQNLPCIDPDGDINDDGQVDMFDMITLLSHMVSLDFISIDTCLDLNADSNIDIIDLLMISNQVF
ncbi:MAG: dockerin type I domain-containing protein [Candidatus Neomarinimicrobiota bacterium]